MKGRPMMAKRAVFASQDIKLHIKPMPKKLAMVPAIITKLVSNSVMFTVSIISDPLPVSVAVFMWRPYDMSVLTVAFDFSAIGPSCHC